MEKEMYSEPNVYTRPMIVNHQPVRFETAQSWNCGKGNLDHKGKGNGGINYPGVPYTGEHNGPGHDNGHDGHGH